MILSEDKRRKRVTSLVKLSTLKLLSNHNLLKDIDNLSLYSHLLKPVLLKLSKQQLMNLEERDPKLMDFTEDVWFQLLQKRFPNSVMSDRTSRENYLQLEQEQDLKRQELINKLRLHTKKLEKQKNSNQIEVIDHIPQQQQQVSKLQFKSSMLQKINKECSIREKKFNHDIRFNQLTNNKRLQPQQQQQQKKFKTATMPTKELFPKKITGSSMFIPRSKPKILQSTTVPKKRKIVKEQQQRQLTDQVKTLKKSSIFVELASVRGQ